MADFLGAILGPAPPALLPLGSALPLASFLPDFLADFLAAGLSDSDADEAELRVVLVVGNAFVLGLREGAFLLLCFFLDFSSPELELEDDDFFPESWESEESSESLELSPLPEELEELELEPELLELELPEEADDEALLEPDRGFGGILSCSKNVRQIRVCFYFDALLKNCWTTDNSSQPRRSVFSAKDLAVPDQVLCLASTRQT